MHFHISEIILIIKRAYKNGSYPSIGDFIHLDSGIIASDSYHCSCRVKCHPVGWVWSHIKTDHRSHCPDIPKFDGPVGITRHHCITLPINFTLVRYS